MKTRILIITIASCIALMSAISYRAGNNRQRGSTRENIEIKGQEY